MVYEIKVNKRIKNKILGGKQTFSIYEIKKVDASTGSLVKLIYGNEFLAWATINPKSKKHYIRVLSLEKDYDLYNDLIEKLKKAKKYRERIGYSNHYRWIYSESDFLSGLIVDKYNEIAVIQNTNPYFENNIDTIVKAILEVDKSIETVYEKSIGKSREEELLMPRERFLYGNKEETIIEEEGYKFIVNIVKGQKTGWFLDQRENRKIAKNFYFGKVLDVFSYTGGFGIMNKEETYFVEKNKNAIEILKRNLELNKKENYKIIRGNAFEILKELYLKKEKFNTIVLDPPDLLADNKTGGWKSLLLINSLAMDLIKDGYLITFSCSQHVDEKKFLLAIKAIARRKGKKIELITKLHQAYDHKVLYPHKELEYLKGFIFHIF